MPNATAFDGSRPRRPPRRAGASASHASARRFASSGARQERQPDRRGVRGARGRLVGPHAVPLALVVVELLGLGLGGDRGVGLGLAVDRQRALFLVGIVGIVLGRILVVVLDARDRRARRGLGDRRRGRRRARALEQAGEVRREHGEHAGLDQQLERAPRGATAQQAVDLLEQARRRALADLAAPAEQRAPGRRLEAERRAARRT